jgi:hypothetical protein
MWKIEKQRMPGVTLTKFYRSTGLVVLLWGEAMTAVPKDLRDFINFRVKFRILRGYRYSKYLKEG